MRRLFAAQGPQKALRDLGNRLRFGPEAPLSDELLFVDPRAIRFCYRPDPAAGAPDFRRRQSGKVVPGDWDLSRVPVEANHKLQSCRMHFEQGLPWDGTPLIRKLTRQIAAGEIPDECRTEEDIQARHAGLDRLFDLARRTGRLNPRRELQDYFRRAHGGILVHVARDGTLRRAGGGAHRFAIAWILRLPEIPVQLGVIHPEAVRDGLHLGLRRPLAERSTAPDRTGVPRPARDLAAPRP
ncbi:MAG: hypothetical protein ACLFQL_00595 [Paracoccaceae bacterium]